MIWVPVIIGTEEVWSPPRLIPFELVEFAIVNAERAGWNIEADGEVTRAAVFWRELWQEITLTEIRRVRRGSIVLIAPGAIRIEVEDVGKPVESPSYELTGKRRELPK